MDCGEKIEISSSVGFDGNLGESQSAKQVSLEYSRTSMSRNLNTGKEMHEVSTSQFVGLPGPKKSVDKNLNKSKIDITVDFTLNVTS